MKVGEWPERQPPALVPVAIVRDETVAGKEDVDVRAIGGGRRRGRIVQLVAFFLAMSGRLHAPEQLTGPAFESQRQELAVFMAGQIDSIGSDHWRPFAPGKRRLP